MSDNKPANRLLRKDVFLCKKGATDKCSNNVTHINAKRVTRQSHSFLWTTCKLLKRITYKPIYHANARISSMPKGLYIINTQYCISLNRKRIALYTVAPRGYTRNKPLMICHQTLLRFGLDKKNNLKRICFRLFFWWREMDSNHRSR